MDKQLQGREQSEAAEHNRRSGHVNTVLETIVEIPRRLSGTGMDSKSSSSTMDPIQNVRRNSANIIEFNERSQELTTIHRRLVRHPLYV